MSFVDVFSSTKPPTGFGGNSKENVDLFEESGTTQAEGGDGGQARRRLPLRTPLPSKQVGQGVDTPKGTGLEDRDPNIVSFDEDEANTAKKDTNSIMTMIWASNDGGTKGLSTLYGSTGQVSSATLLMMLMIPMLPVYYFAPYHTEWNKNPVASLAVFVEILKKMYPRVHTEILGICKTKGAQNREALRRITTRLFGMFGHQIHAAFIYGIMIYIWCHDDSEKHEQMYAMLM